MNYHRTGRVAKHILAQNRTTEQNRQGGKTCTSTELDNGTQNTESRTRRKKANKDRQYLQEP